MKKSGLLIPVGIFLAFVFFTLGFFCARTRLASPVILSRPDLTTSAPTETSLPEQRETAPSSDDREDGLLLDLNTATAQELELLPGIGPVLAQRIMDYRAQHGGFSSLEELEEVDGIGPARLQKLLPHLTIGGKKE